MILSDALILPVLQLQIQQIRSQIEYFILTYHILVLILYRWKYSVNGGF